jgi:hypothetical protein
LLCRRHAFEIGRAWRVFAETNASAVRAMAIILRGFDVMLIVRGWRGDEVISTVRLRTASAMAKARELTSVGWRVTIECPNGLPTHPDDFGPPFHTGSNIVDRTLDETTPNSL